MEEGLLEKTGKDLKHWIGVVKKSGHEKHKAIMDYLKAEHGFTHGFANFVALKANASDAASFGEEELLENQYKGKEGLKPVYDSLMKYLLSLGTDIKVAPKKDSVSLIRKAQFALLKPATKTRMDIGIKLKGQEPEGKLGPSGPFGAMCTHRICVESENDIDQEVKDWIRKAYEASV